MHTVSVGLERGLDDCARPSNEISIEETGIQNFAKEGLTEN
jgi:hypothetical protein